MIHDCIDLEQHIEQQIQRCTYGRIRQLNVEVRDDRMVVRGWTTSYYVVQLVVHAVRELLPETPVTLDIQVCAQGGMSGSTERRLTRV